MLPLQICATDLPGVVCIEPAVYGDRRGYFQETWHRRAYAEAGIDVDFVQDNLSRSTAGTLRGLHFQTHQPQGKLVYVLEGEVLDVAVDLRPDSSCFGKWVAVTLSAENHRQLYVPPGFAHGFCVASATAVVAYKCTDYYLPTAERVLAWNDPDLAIAWPTSNPVLSERDQRGQRLRELFP